MQAERVRIRSFGRSFFVLPCTHTTVSRSLYPSCPWDDKAIRRLIGDGKLAGRYKGSDDGLECPICFFSYPHVNQTLCCQGLLCTECFLQIKPQKKGTPCPFCNHPKLSVKICKDSPEEEEVILETKSSTEAPPEESVFRDRTSSFGSEVAEPTRLVRERSTSMDDTPTLDPAERLALEESMRAQQFHPLSQRLAQEEAERRIQNEQSYQTERLQNLRSRREHGRRALHQVDDIAVLEALMHGGHPLARARVAQLMRGRTTTSSGTRGPSMLRMMFMTEEEQLELAIQASLRDSQPPASSGEDDGTEEQATDESGASVEEGAVAESHGTTSGDEEEFPDPMYEDYEDDEEADSPPLDSSNEQVPTQDQCAPESPELSDVPSELEQTETDSTEVTPSEPQPETSSAVPDEQVEPGEIQSSLQEDVTIENSTATVAPKEASIEATESSIRIEANEVQETSAQSA